ncbi:MAG: hypothetical protein HY921_02440 [Elusimicrobia bacterium]|nr:hypothetical protein [Elusimicrobiota bacterium]
MSDGNFKLMLYALVGGPAAVAWGLDSIRRKRLIENTPTSKVRSAAMGLVELSGRARRKFELLDPISRLPCCWWKSVVQEFVESGKNSHWRDIREICSPGLFYLEDETGRVLIDAHGAELTAEEYVLHITDSNWPRLAPVLMTWGVSSGPGSKMRVKQQTVYEMNPLYVLGELTRAADHVAERGARFSRFLQEAKKDPKRMADADKNGQIDPMEWDAFYAKLEEEFRAKDAAASHPVEDDLIVKKPADQPMIVSTALEKELLQNGGFMSLAALIAGLGAFALGVWLAFRQELSPSWVVVLAAGGAAAGFMFKFKFKR